MAEKILSQIQDDRKGFFRKYRDLSVGRQGFLFFLKYELICLLFGSLPGSIGLLGRAISYRWLFKTVGKSVFFGTDIRIRNPRTIEIGDQVVIDDHCVLDAKGDNSQGIVLGQRTFLSRDVILSCKNGGIHIGREASLGPFTTIHSVDKSLVRIGDYSVIAAYCYFIGGGNYRFQRTDIPMIKQGFEEGQGIRVGTDVWIGASTMITDGATIGDGAIIGANSLVRGEIPPYSIAYGNPAVVKGWRDDGRRGLNRQEIFGEGIVHDPK
jgi:acetyltransferase-like isoleucine patch superfamily enzyme